MTRFFVENTEHAEITASFEMELQNLVGSTNFPFTATYPPHKVIEAFTLRPAKPDQEWSFKYVSRYTIGSMDAHHDDHCLYRLPYPPGAAFRVTQGYNGSFSHCGPDQYAIDWKMKPGTPIHAARDGRVVKVKIESNTGGPDRKYENNANYILIRHEDGTLANYAHLQKGGAQVIVGQHIQAGDLIGYSGNTGFSSGPHLHFSVFKTKSGALRESLPVHFSTAEYTSATLAEGKSYRCKAQPDLAGRGPDPALADIQKSASATRLPTHSGDHALGGGAGASPR